MGKEEDEGGKAAVGTSLRVSFSIAAAASPCPNQPSYSSNHLKEKRRMFSVELNPGHTTIVSWKKLLRGSNTNNKSSSKNNNALRGGPAAELQYLEGELQDAQPSNRFSAVIEKIKRLYMDEYFQVDKLSTKHYAYFVNRGKLEGIAPGLAPKKRKRKDLTEVDNKTMIGQAKRDDRTMGIKRIKAATRNAPLIGKNLTSPARIQSANGERHQGNFLKHNINTFTGNSRPTDFTTDVENMPSGLSKDVSLQSFDSNSRKGVLPSRDPIDKSRRINEFAYPARHEYQDKAVGSQVQSRSRKSLNCENAAEISTTVRWKDAYGTDGIPRMDSNVDTYPMHLVRPSFTQLNGGSTGRPKSTALESAIRDLEKIVALCRPQKLDIQDMGSSSQGVTRRLPQDVKQILAKVARLSAGQSKISEDDLIDRLMDIVGHMVQRKTLKRNIREMAETGPSEKQQKSDQKQLIKKEIKKMIMIRVSLLKSKVAEQQIGSAEDFQVSANEERRVLKKYIMDRALEDKLSELFDLYVEGIHEDKGPQHKNLFKEFAEFWPNGYIDCNGIKDAISRSKARKRSRFYRHKVCDPKGIKMKKSASAAMVEETNRHMRSPSTNSTSPTRIVLTSNQPVASSPSLGDSGRRHLSKHRDKARISSTSIVSNAKKMMKRKPESDSGVIHDHPAKIVQQTRERPNAQKHGEGLNSCHQAKQILRLPATSPPSVPRS